MASQLLVRCEKYAGGLVIFALVLIVSGMFQTVAARDEPAPVFEAVNESGVTSETIREMGQRLSQLERQMDNQALVEMMSNMDRLHQEIQQLVGQLEEQTHSLDSMRKRQRDLYLDIDQRMQALEKARDTAMVAPTPVPAATPGLAQSEAKSVAKRGLSEPQLQAQTPAVAVSGAAPPAVSATVTPPDTQLERKNYEMAFNLLKEGQYDSAVAAFQAFLGTYPAGRFADNAQYWLGEANYVQRRFNQALVEFDKVVTNYPDSPKRADTMLKMGYTYQELGDHEKARVLLNDVIRTYPTTTAASLAKKRLQDFKLFQ